MPNKFINPYNFVSSNFKSKSEGKIEKGEFTGVIHCQLITKTPLAIPDVEAKAKTEVKDHFYYPFYKQNDTYMIPGSSLRGPIRFMYETLTDSCYVTTEENDRITYRAKSAFKPGILKKNENNEWELYQAQRHLLYVTDSTYKKVYDDKIPEGLQAISLADLNEKYYHGQTVYFKLVSGENADYQHIIKRKDKPDIRIPIGKWVKDINTIQKNGYSKGILCIGEVLPVKKDGSFQSNKHFESIFVEQNNSKVDCINLEQAVEDLKIILERYNDHTLNPNSKEKDFYPGRNYKGFESGEQTPIWYEIYEVEKDEKDGKKIVHKKVKYVRLSVASLGRSVYSRSMKDLLGQKKPCTNRNEVCKACALFGMVGTDKEENTLGSKIRVTDAKCIEGKILEKQTLRELSSPKSSYLLFYAKTSDYIKGYDADGATIRGRKFYWHNLKEKAYEAPKNKYNKIEKTERNSTIDLLTDAIFEFDVYCDQIRDDQLKELVWTLTLGENQSDGTKCYKIGHGKPIGLGSCKIIIESIQERKYDEDYQVNERTDIDELIKEVTDSFENKDANERVFNKNIVTQVSTISDLNYLQGYDVNYPNVVDSNGNFYKDAADNNRHAAHVWFSKNNPKGNGQGVALPTIQEAKNTQLKYFVVPDTNGNQGRNNSSADMKQGKIIKYFADKNFGFISCNGMENDIYFQSRSFLPNDLSKIKVGAKVEFIVGQGKKGTAAVNCKIKK